MNQRDHFRDRREAGEHLAELLTPYANRTDVVILGIPRGGVPVAFEVAERLRTPLDVFIVSKLGVPGREELAMGAIASGGAYVLNPEVIHEFDISSAIIDEALEKARKELYRREQLYRDSRR